MPHLISLLTPLFLYPALAILQPSPGYQHGPVPFDQTGQLWYTVDKPARTARFALLVTDDAVVGNLSDSNWLGLGISEPTSGSMLGADVVTAEFKPLIADTCTITDRHVPFFAYPLGEPADDGSSAFPLMDDCQDDGSWVLLRCEREPGSMILEVERGLDAHDDQDRAILDESNALIYAYGNGFGYHGGRRRGMQVDLFKDDAAETGLAPLPDDVDGSFEFLNTNYTVPSTADTIYSCTSKLVELDGLEKRMIVAVEPVLRSEIDMIHHLTVYLCSGEEYAAKTEETVECTTSSSEDIGGPVGNEEAKCATFVYGYAKGSSRLVLPREAGIVVSSKRQYLVMESHFDNPEAIAGNIDNSGLRLYYTDTMRENEAGSLSLADGSVTRFGQTVVSGFEYEHTCPSECTSKFKETVNMYGSFLHMHTTGKEIYTNKFSEDGKFIESVSQINFWSDAFQQFRAITPFIRLKPGEQLATTCVYDTSKRPETEFGLRTRDEMCMHFIGYYPVQKDPVTNSEINICEYVFVGTGQGDTLCGDNAQDTEELLLGLPNPKFNDSVGAPTAFGAPIETCPVESVAPTQTPDVGTPMETPMETSAVETSDPKVTPETSSSPLISEDPSISPAANEDGNENDDQTQEDDDAVCFPADATVKLSSGDVKRMEDVVVGDEVSIGREEFSKVFMLTHREKWRRYWFVELEVAGRVLHVTRGHFVYANGGLMKAGRVKVGDWMWLDDGSIGTVNRVGGKWKRGLFSPQTMKGDIAVAGVLVSTYTEAIQAGIAHALLAPLRWVYMSMHVDLSGVICER